MDRYEQKLRLTEDTIKVLNEDKESFKLEKLSDNEFYSSIIINTKKYLDTNKNSFELIRKILLEDKCFADNKIIENIRNQTDIKRRDKEINDISLQIMIKTYGLFYPDSKSTITKNVWAKKHNQYDLKGIVLSSHSLSASQILSGLIKCYTLFPPFIRELICFYDTYNILINNGKNNILRVETENSQYDLLLHDILRGGNDSHNYIVGKFKKINESDFKLRSFKLSTIVSCFKLNDLNDLQLTNKELDIIKKNPEWLSDTSKTVIIKFDDKGLKKFNENKINKPSFKQTGENVYELTSNINHLFTYLIQFGQHFELIKESDNNNLYDRLSKFFNNAAKKFPLK